ncbi:alcohol dehydrogenase catalytic domain-containing protein [Lachnospiraceae bacterium 62-26]
MLAVVKEHSGPGFSIKEVPMPVCREEDVIVRVRSVGFCGTDGPILAGTREVPWPMIPGHEFAGDIVETGAKAEGWKVGDRVSACIVIGCGNCKYCIEGNEPLCDNLVETGIHVDGAFAEYVRVPSKVLVKLRDTTSYDFGAAVDPVASAYRTVKKMPLTSKDTVMVLGPGPIGLYATQLLKLRGARKVIVLGADCDKDRLEMAKKLGADYVINNSVEDAIERVREITEGEMLDFVQDCAGAVPLVETAMNSLKKTGHYYITGLFHKLAPTDLGKVVRSEIDIHGTICYTREEFRECLQLIEDGRINVPPMITHHFSLTDMEQAFEVFQSRQAIKIMIHP